MHIPVFGSCPTRLNDRQNRLYLFILGELGHAGLEWRNLGRTEYPIASPLREVLLLAKHCSGGVILGFSQFETDSGTWKAGTPKEVPQESTVGFPTPWNHLEAGILFSLGMPLLVFREDHVSGGICDNGVTDVFIHRLPRRLDVKFRKQIVDVIKKWSGEVQHHYYNP